MDPQETLSHLVSSHGYWAIASIVGLESMGIPFPGETVLLLAAWAAGKAPKRRSIVLLSMVNVQRPYMAMLYMSAD